MNGRILVCCFATCSFTHQSLFAVTAVSPSPRRESTLPSTEEPSTHWSPLWTMTPAKSDWMLSRSELKVFFFVSLWHTLGMTVSSVCLSLNSNHNYGTGFCQVCNGSLRPLKPGYSCLRIIFPCICGNTVAHSKSYLAFGQAHKCCETGNMNNPYSVLALWHPGAPWFMYWTSKISISCKWSFSFWVIGDGVAEWLFT